MIRFLKKNVLENISGIRIFLKELNGIEKTNLKKNIYGTVLYHTRNIVVPNLYPIIFPEKTTFSLIILLVEDLLSSKLYDGKAYISLFEIDN